MEARLPLTRSQILAFRRRAGGLGERLAPGEDSLRRAAWAGLQDSMPRAALSFARSAFRNACVVCGWDAGLAASAEGTPPPVV